MCAATNMEKNLKTEKSKKTLKIANVIVLAGQSNAVGVGYTKYLSSSFDENTVKRFYDGYEKILIDYCSHGIESKGFVKTRVNCTEVAKDTFGPELGIAKNLTARYPDEEFFIVKCAYGGASLHNDWISPSGGGGYSPLARAAEFPDIVQALNSGKRPTAGWCYNEFVCLLRGSLARLEERGYLPKIRAFFWMQGESDSYSQELVESYVGWYDGLLRDFRTTFSAYLQDCVYVDGGISQNWKYYRRLNELKKAYAERTGGIFLDTVAMGLTTTKEPYEAPDVAHYDSESTVRLGEAFAENLRV